MTTNENPTSNHTPSPSPAHNTIAIGAAKEKWIDNKWDGGDFTADCIGVLLYHIEF